MEAILAVVTDDGNPIRTYIEGIIGQNGFTSEVFGAVHKIVGVRKLPEKCELHIKAESPGFRQLCVTELTEETVLPAVSITDAEENWVKTFVRLDAASMAGSNVTIGIVDCVQFPLPPELSHLRVRDWAGRAATPRLGFEVLQHGTNVCRLLGYRNPRDGESPLSLARHAKINVYPLHAEERDGEEYIPEDVLGGAIDAASRDGCDLINVSAGIAHEPLGSTESIFDKIIADAKARGSVIVAAGGNNFGEPIREPARHADVVAVGAVGLVDCAHEHTYAAHLLRKARKYGGKARFGYHNVMGDTFVTGAVGPELNLVFPGCSVYCNAGIDGATFELFGSSYAAPVATATLSRLYTPVAVNNSGAGRHSMLMSKLEEDWRLSLGDEPWNATIYLGRRSDD